MIFRYNKHLPSIWSGSQVWGEEWEGEDSTGVVRTWKAEVSDMVFYHDLVSGELTCKLHYKVLLYEEISKEFVDSNLVFCWTSN